MVVERSKYCGRCKKKKRICDFTAKLHNAKNKTCKICSNCRQIVLETKYNRDYVKGYDKFIEEMHNCVLVLNLSKLPLSSAENTCAMFSDQTHMSEINTDT